MEDIARVYTVCSRDMATARHNTAWIDTVPRVTCTLTRAGENRRKMAPTTCSRAHAGCTVMRGTVTIVEQVLVPDQSLAISAQMTLRRSQYNLASRCDQISAVLLRRVVAAPRLLHCVAGRGAAACAAALSKRRGVVTGTSDAASPPCV